MKILQFIVVEETENIGVHSVLGECYVPLGVPVPVIMKGKGCFGVGIVKRLTITPNSTKIEFKCDQNIAEDAKKAYYDLYRNNISTNASEDPYEDTDQVIPGAMIGRKRNNNTRPRYYDHDFEEDHALSDYIKGL